MNDEYIYIYIYIYIQYIYVSAWNFPNVFLKNPKLFEGKAWGNLRMHLFSSQIEVKFGVKTFMSSEMWRN